MIKNENTISQLSEPVRRALSAMSFEELTPIQEMALPELLAGRDLIGQAQTGSGKTAAFGIPILEALDLNNNKLQSLILVPTRELAMQISEEILRLGRYLKDLTVMPVFGGTPIYRQIRRLKYGVQVVVGTPGRVLDLIERKVLKLESVELFVLDEADEMFDMGFRDDIAKVMIHLHEPQKVFFSATMPKAILNFAKEHQENPVTVKIEDSDENRPDIEQLYYMAPQRLKMKLLQHIMADQAAEKAVIFCNTQRMVDSTTNKLKSWGYSAEGLHGGMTQGARTQIMQKFRGGHYTILVATDVAARGIDVSDIDLIINYDIPTSDAYYVHRIGRTARAGQKGRAITIVTPNTYNRISEISAFSGAEIEARLVPKEWEILEEKREKKADNTGKKPSPKAKLPLRKSGAPDRSQKSESKQWRPKSKSATTSKTKANRPKSKSAFVPDGGSKRPKSRSFGKKSQATN